MMSSMSLQAPDVTRGFKIVTKMFGRPNYTSIKLLFKQTHCNAKSVPSQNGNGHQGHLGCCFTLVEFNARLTPSEDHQMPWSLSLLMPTSVKPTE
jgi:hypothetical protein